MKRGLLLSIAIMICMHLFGNSIDEITAKQLAQNFWKTNNIIGVKGEKIFKKRMDDARFVNVAQQCGYSEFFIFNNENGKGFVIIAADDCVTPILAYSYDNNFVTENLPPNLIDWLDGYAEQIRMVVGIKIDATSDIQREWQCLYQEKNLPIKSETQVYPLIATTWDQSPYYNDLCPYDYTQNERTLTGCVATAMAQIMKYWSYPEHGFGSHSYIPETHPEYGIQFANFSGTTYQWSAMPNNVTSNNNAVATLMYHCGVAVEMKYGAEGSSAYVLDFGKDRPCAENALKTFFDYKSTLHGIVKSDYTSDSQWITLLKEELNNARPILYFGSNASFGGHAFVCDGYNNSNYFHFNWGWSGEGNNAYYYINNLNPLNISYSSLQHALVGIEPNNTTYNFDLVYYSTPIMSSEEYLFFNYLDVYAEVLNNGSGAFNGYIGAGVWYELTPGSDEYYLIDVIDEVDCTTQPLPGGYYSYHNYECAGGPPYIPGSYLVTMLYSMDEDYWNLIDVGDYGFAYFDIVSSYTIDVFSDLSIITGDGSCLYQNSDATINVNVINNGSSTFYGQFRIGLYDSDGDLVQVIDDFDCTNGLQSNNHFTNGINFTGLVVTEPGTYLMAVEYKRTGESDWYFAGASDYQNPVWVYVAPEPVYADPYEPNNSQDLAYLFTPSFSGNSAEVNTTGSNLHNSSDVDYYKINLDTGFDYIITPRLHDSYNSGNGNYYSVDAQFAYSIDEVNWSEYYDDEMTGGFSLTNGGTVYFEVVPYYEGEVGTYQLSVDIAQSQGSGNCTILISANPSTGGSVSISGEMTYNFDDGTLMGWTNIDANNDGYGWVLGSQIGGVYLVAGGSLAGSGHNSSADMVCSGSYSNAGGGPITPDNYLVSPIKSQCSSISFWACAQDANYPAEHFGVAVSTTTATASEFTTIQEWTMTAKDNLADGEHNDIRGTKGMGAWYHYTVDLSSYVGQDIWVAIRHFGCNDMFVLDVDDISINNIGGFTYNQGQICTVSAAAYPGYDFINWTENGTQVSTDANYTFTVTGNRTLVANFQSQQQQYTVNVSANPGAGGNVTGGGTYDQGASCTVHAVANSGYVFINWTENGSPVSTSADYTFIVDENRNLVANFEQNTYTIIATAGANGVITPFGSITVAQGANQSFAMIPDAGYEVQNVYVDGNPVGSMTSYTFTNVNANHQIYVTFIQVDDIEENEGIGLIIYPNPTSGEVVVKYEGLKHISVVNPLGQLVYDTDIDSDQAHVDLSSMIKGVYIVQIEANEQQITRKIIVK